MKADKLIGYTLLLDADCPMCKLYAHTFEGLDMIESTTAVPYQHAEQQQVRLVDMEKARNEIALVNHHTKEVYYGLDSLGHILSTRLPWITFVLTSTFVRFFLDKLYKFISFNRKVIAPSSSANGTMNRLCIPDFHLGYRIAYLVFALVFSSCVLGYFFQPVYEQFYLGTSFYPILFIGAFPFIGQNLVLWKCKWERRIEYLGNMATIFLIGALLIVPMLLIQHVVYVSDLGLMCYSSFVAIPLLLEHIRRCRLLAFSSLITLSWIAWYWMEVLLILWLKK